ncbi:SxtJ family membrane protein [Alphaproteobacteria bacterium]|nr:SxtJ family membrane protein [Alphaproteobacteria bacterium]
MKIPELELPSNRKFGFFFSIVFFIFATYFLYRQSQTIAYSLFFIAILFIVISFFKSDLLLPLNKLWMRFGFILGMIVSPIIMGIIFFGLITPYAIIMRIMGRDELRLKKTNNESYWILRSQNLPQTDFKRQF